MDLKIEPRTCRLTFSSMDTVKSSDHSQMSQEEDAVPAKLLKAAGCFQSPQNWVIGILFTQQTHCAQIRDVEDFYS